MAASDVFPRIAAAFRNHGRPLPVGLRRRAELFYGADLSAVRLHAVAGLSDLPALAVTRGDNICLTFDALTLPTSSLLELTGHEIAHVVQQRQGRIRALRGSLAAVLDDDPTLESEASDAGRRFAAGAGVSGFGATTRRHVRRSGVQCAVAVGGRAIGSADELSEKSRKVLALIPSASRWLTWAMNHPSDVYGFSDEPSLVEAVHSGLHGGGLVLLRAPALQVSIQRLLELRLEDLSLLEALERRRGDLKRVDVRTKRMLAVNNLWTQTDLAVGRDFVGEDLDPVFQSLSLGDQVQLFNLVEGASTDVALDPRIQEEATSFALERAIDPAEFVDFYQLYVTVADALGGARGTVNKRRTLPGRLVSALEPHIYGLLKCPFVAHDLTPATMMEVARAWQASGNPLGFSRISRGLRELVEHGGADALEPDAAPQIVARYVDGVAELLRTGEPVDSELSQDGSTRVLRVEDAASHGNLVHARHRATLTVERFRRT